MSSKDKTNKRKAASATAATTTTTTVTKELADLFDTNDEDPNELSPIKLPKSAKITQQTTTIVSSMEEEEDIVIPSLETAAATVTPFDQSIGTHTPPAPLKETANHELHRTDDAQLNRKLLDEFNKADGEADALMNQLFSPEVIGREIMKVLNELAAGEIASGITPEQIQERLKQYELPDLKNVMVKLMDDGYIYTTIDDHHYRASIALEEYDQKTKPTTTGVLEENGDYKAIDIFDASVEYDIANYHNLHFDNPLVESADITFRRNQNKQTKKWYENINVKFQSEANYQMWNDQRQWSATFITPPGYVENFNAPPYGNISDYEEKLAEERKETKDRDQKVLKRLEYAPKTYEECKASFIFTSKHFTTKADRDLIEYDARTRRVYTNKKEDDNYNSYLIAHPGEAVPQEAIAWNQDGPLSKQQLEELPENARYSYQSYRVNKFFNNLETRVESMYFERLEKDIENVAPSFKESVLKAIATDIEKRQKEEDAAALAAKRPKQRLTPLTFDEVRRMNTKSGLKIDTVSGVKQITFKNKMFRKATDREVAEMKAGKIEFPSLAIKKICTENKPELMFQTFDIYRYSTPEELAADPNLAPLKKLSTMEAYQLITVQNEGRVIGQTVFSVGPLLINGRQQLYYRPQAFIFWAPAKAFKEARIFERKIEHKQPMKRVVAPIPSTFVNTTSAANAIDYSKSEIIPKAIRYERKEESTAATTAQPQPA